MRILAPVSRQSLPVVRSGAMPGLGGETGDPRIHLAWARDLLTVEVKAEHVGAADGPAAHYP